MDSDEKPDNIAQPSLLTTEPTQVGAPIGSSAENIANEEGSLFEKGLIDTNRTMNEKQASAKAEIRQSTEFDEDNGSLAGPNPHTRQQEHMQSTHGDRAIWSPSENARSQGKEYYKMAANNGVDGIIGKLGRLEAMILAQGQGRKKKNEPVQKVAYPLKQTTIDRIIYPVYTKKGLKYGKPKKPKRDPSQQDGVMDQQALQEPMGKLLDGFLILYSCRVKLPHEAIKSKLASQKIVEVIEEDLCYFQNLNAIDLSDNKVRLEQLRNLKSLFDVNLQYNNIQSIPPLVKDDFPKLEVLNLSYNQITPASIRHLYQLPRLKNLDLQGNNLVTLPDDLKELRHLEELNLSSNNLSTQSTLINPAILMKVLGQIPRLKRLNLSRNKLQGLHFDLLSRDDDYTLLQDLDFGYNLVNDEEEVWYASQMKNLQLLVITGNPFALNGKQAYARLEEAMQKNLSATVINEDVPDQKSYLKAKPKNLKQNFPYPNPIKLFSRDMNNNKEIKGEYLNAELMNQGVALQISEIRPDTNIEQEIFPQELTRDAQEKEIFTPPNHKQMRFLRSGGPAPSNKDEYSSSNNDQFFITENIVDSHPMMGDSKIIHEERSQQESELEEQNDDNSSTPKGDNENDASEIDANFDFGRAKMDYFKQRAKDILMSETDLEYDGHAMQMAMCFKNLKNAIRNPVVVHAGAETQPHYLKMTFSTARAAVNGDRFLEMSKLIGSNGNLKPEAVSQSSMGGGTHSISKIPALMRAGKEMHEESLMMLSGLLGTTVKKKSKKEDMIDKKIEYLLETYKKQDEELLKRAGEKTAKRKADRKKLRDKFGFSDDEEEDDIDDGEEVSSKSDAKLQTQKSKELGGKFNQASQNGVLPPVKLSTNKKIVL